METRAHYGIIGVFVLAVLAGAFLFVHWFSSSETGPRTETVLVVFEDSIAGLNKGSEVLFNGIRVGQVNRVYFDVKRPERAFAEVSIEQNTPLRVDTQARLNTTILSGYGVIVLNGGAPGAATLVAKEGEALPTIYAQRSGIASIIEQAQGLSGKAEALREQVNAIADENRDTLTATWNNIQALTETLSRNGPGLSKSMASISDAGAKLGPLGDKLSAVADDASAIKRAVDPNQVGVIMDRAAALRETITDNRPRLDTIQSNLSALSPRLGAIGPKAERAATDAGRVTASIDGDKVGRVASNIDKIQSTFARIRPDSDAVQQNADEIGQKFSGYSNRFDALRKQYAAFIDSEAGHSAFTSVGQAITAIRNTSNRLDTHIQAISTAISRFSGSSARDFRAVGTDAGRAMGDVSQTSRNLKRRFLGDQQRLPTYTGP
jgi:phospholipid/cholesterol/gamma-HCH transport system substrate-binding protein